MADLTITMQKDNQKSNSNFLLAAIACIILLACAVYANSFKAPFVFDDFHNIAENPFLKIKNLSLDSLTVAAANSKISQRWLANLSFALNYYFLGQDVWGYHLVNLLIHILTGISIFLLFRETVKRPVLSELIKRPDEIALLAALLWLVHPIQTNAVTYIVQRMTSMAALFTICSLLTYIHGRTKSVSPFNKYCFFSCSFIFALLAFGCKENSAMLPVMIIAYEYFFISEQKTNRLLRISVLATLAVLLLFILGAIYFGTNPISAVISGYADRHFTLFERLLTQPRVIFFYIGLLIIPLPALLNINHDLPISVSFFSPLTTLPAILGITGLIALSVYLYKRNRLFSFAIFWFLGNLLIESSIIPLEIVFEHRLYLPAIFLILSAVLLIEQQLHQFPPVVFRITIITLIVLFSIATWQRNTVWATSVDLWTDVVKKSPNLARGHINLGKAFLHERRFAEAEQELRHGIELDKETSYGYTNLAVLCEKQNRLIEALTLSNIALEKKDADQVKLHHNLGIVYFKLNDHQKALDELNIALALAPDYSDAYVTLGAIFGKSGNHTKAEELLLKAIELDPGNGYAYQNLGSAYERLNRLDKAKDALEKALLLPNVDPVKIHNNLGIVYWRLVDFQHSITHALAAIDLDPNFLEAYLTLAITYEDMGKQEEAFTQFREAWKRGYPMINTYQDWARQLLQDNREDKAISYLREAINLAPDQASESKELLQQALTQKSKNQ